MTDAFDCCTATVLVGIAIAVLAVATAASAAKPGPGTSTGKGSVFVSNPVEDLNDQSLRDQKDSASAVPAAATWFSSRTWTGSGFLRGRWVRRRTACGASTRTPLP